MKLKSLDSPRNPLVKRVADVRDRKVRSGEFMAEGPHLAESALAAGADIRQAFVTESFIGAHRGLVKRFLGAGAEVYEISERILLKLAGTESPQGILAIVSLKPSALDTAGAKGVVVVLDGVQDPGNVGTIVRTADAAGASAVVLLEGTADAFSQKALRASSGSVFNIKIVYAKRKAVAGELHAKGYKIAATLVDAEVSVFDADLSGPLALVFGNETRGVSAELRREADLAVRIPVRGGAESLNVASSAAVALYEVMRRGAASR